MTMHNMPGCNPPEMIAAMRSYGIRHDRPDMIADAFRLGWLAAQPGWAPDRCEGCDCQIGGFECKHIRGRRPHVTAGK